MAFEGEEMFSDHEIDFLLENMDIDEDIVVNDDIFEEEEGEAVVVEEDDFDEDEEELYLHAIPSIVFVNEEKI